MKKTIKEENNRKILESRYLNDNTLLEFVLEGNQVVASIRYVSGVVSGIREITLATMSLEDYANNLSKIFEENEEKNAIAIFKRDEQGNYELRNVFDVEEHSYAILEFMDIVYAKKFPNKKLNKNLTRN